MINGLNREPQDKQHGRLCGLAATSSVGHSKTPPVDYQPRRHCGQRLPFHAIPAVVFYLLATFLLVGTASYTIKTIWPAREEFVTTHAILPEHRLNLPVTATTVETGAEGRERLLVADRRNLFIATPVKRLRYWQWFPLENLPYSRAGSIIFSLSANNSKLAIVPELDGRRQLVLGTFPGIGSQPRLWSRPEIDSSSFPSIADDTARSVLFDPTSGDRFVGGPGIAAYDPIARHWKRPLLLSTNSDTPRVNDLTALADGMFAALGGQGIDILSNRDGFWRTINQVARTGAGGLDGGEPMVAHFSPTGEHSEAGTGQLTYLTRDEGLGQLRLSDGGIDGNEVRIGEGRADNVRRDAIVRAQAGARGDSAWMLYRKATKDGAKDGALGVALYRFRQHQMLGLPSDHPISVGADPIISADPLDAQTAWVGGRGLFAVQPDAKNSLKAVNTRLVAERVEDVAAASDRIFAATRIHSSSSSVEATGGQDSAPSAPQSAAQQSPGGDTKDGAVADGPISIQSAPRKSALGGETDAWASFVGSRRLNRPLKLEEITAATDATFGSLGHNTLILGTRDKGLAVFDRESRELFQPVDDKALSPGTLDLHARGSSIVQVGSDHSVNFFDGASWQRLISSNGTDLQPEHIRSALSDGADLVVSDGQSTSSYSAQSHEWRALPKLETKRMALAFNSLWAIGPKDVLYRLPLSDPKSWQPINPDEQVIALDAQPDLISVIDRLSATIRVWVMGPFSTEPNVLFQSNESSGDSSEWRTFAIRRKQLFVMPHGGSIGHYDGDSHSWSSISLPKGSGPPRDLAATEAGLWFVDGSGRAYFQPFAGSQWMTAAEKVQRLRSDGRSVAILTEDGHVAVSEQGAPPLHTIVGDALSTTPDRITTGVLFKDTLMMASDVGVHRYDPIQHGWDNAALSGDPIVEFAHSSAAVYGRTRNGAVLLWGGDKVGGWSPVNDGAGKPVRAERLTSAEGSYVAAASRDNGVVGLFPEDPSHARQLLASSRLRASGAISAAAEVGDSLVLGTGGGSVSIYAKTGDGPRSWTNDLTNPTQTGPVQALLVPPGRTDRLVVAGTAVSVLARQATEGRWAPPSPVLRQMSLAQVAVDQRNLYGLDSGAGAPNSLARVDLSNGQESPIVGAPFPNGSGATAATRAIGIAPQQPEQIWRAGDGGQVAAYDARRHGWQKSNSIADVDRFFVADGKLWSWSRARGELAQNEGGNWRRDPRPWREVANDSEQLVLLDANGSVIVRDHGGERTLIDHRDQPLPLSSAADIAAMVEQDGRLFIATRKGPVLSYDPATHHWNTAVEVTDVVEFVATGDRSSLFARTSKGALFHLDSANLAWRSVDLPPDQVTSVVPASAQLVVLSADGNLYSLDNSGRMVASYRTGVLGADAAKTLTISAAAELDGNLLLVARINGGPPRAIAYAPNGHRWQRLDTAAEPAYFLTAGPETWLLERSGSDVLLQHLKPGEAQDDGQGHTVSVGRTFGPFRDVSSSREALVALSASAQSDAALFQVTPHGLVPLDIAKAALPPGRRVIGAGAAGEDCVVLLDNGAVEHYTPDHRWVERLAPHGGDPGILTIDPGNSHTQLLRAGLKPLRWVADRLEWVEQVDKTAAPAPAPTPGQVSPGPQASGTCRALATAPKPVFQRMTAGRQETLTLVDFRFDVDVIRQAWLAGDRLYLSTLAGTTRVLRLRNGDWREELGQAVAIRPEPNPIAFSGERFGASLDPTGAFGSARGPLRLTMRLPGGDRMDLAPALRPNGIAMAHDVIRSAIADGDTIYAGTAAGVARLTRRDAGLILSAVDGPQQGLTGLDIVRVARSAGRLVAIDRGGQAWEQSADMATWRRASAPAAADEPTSPPQSWRLERSAAGVRLLRAMPDNSFAPVTLTDGGFGFDRVWGIWGSEGEIQLFTDDGRVRLARGESYGNLHDLDRTVLRPFPSGAGELVEVEDDGKVEVWARAQGSAWRYDGQAWQAESEQDFLGAVKRRQPMLWDDGATSWSRNDAVVLSLAGARVATRFDAARGRFDIDQPTAIAADQNGLAALTTAGVVRYAPDSTWQGVSWPVGVALGAAMLASRPEGVALNTGGSWYGWDGQQWSPLGAKEIGTVTRPRNVLLDGRLWRLARRGDIADVEMRTAESQEFQRVKMGDDGRFDMESVRDIIFGQDGLWAATQFGMVQIDPKALDLQTLQPTAHPVAQLASGEGATVARLDDGSMLEYREGTWQPGGAPEIFSAAAARVLESGPWHWTRANSGPKVVLDPDAAQGLWSGGAPLDVGFAGNRFAFDAVRDAAVADRPWLATAVGLIGRSGAQSARIDSFRPGTLTEGDGRSGVFAVAAPDGKLRLFARIDGGMVMLDGGEWGPAPTAFLGQSSIIQDQGFKTADFAVTRPGGHVVVSVRFPEDPPEHYMAAVFDPTLRRFRHDMPTRISRDPSESKKGVLIATKGGLLAVDVDSRSAVRLFADPSVDGIGTDEVQWLAYLPAAKRSLALLANGRIKRLDTNGKSWVEAGTEDAKLLDAARHVPYDNPRGWRVEVAENAPPRIFWRREPAMLVAEQSGQSAGTARFAHDVAQSAFIDEHAILVGTRGGLVRIPINGLAVPAPGDFSLQTSGVLSPDEISQRIPPRGIGFLRPSRGSIYARREIDGQAIRLSSAGIEVVAAADRALAASQVVARDTAWNWTKTSSAPTRMTPSAVFHVNPDYKFLDGTTWSFLDFEDSNRRFPHHSMVAFGDDLFVATAGGVSRFAPKTDLRDAASREPSAEPAGFITAVYAQGRDHGASQPMTDVAELHVTANQKLTARTRSNDYFVFDPERDEWQKAPPNTDLSADLWRVADTALLDWRFDEAGRQTITVRPLSQDLPDQSKYPLFVNGRFAFDDVRATLDVGDALWLATGGGVCIYDRASFTPRRFVASAFLDADRTANGASGAAGAVRELVRDPDHAERFVGRTDSGMVLESPAAGDFRPATAAVTDGLDVFERAYTREAPGPRNGQMRFVQYPFGSYRFPNGAVRARFRDGAGNWVELGASSRDRGLQLFSHQRFSFDDLSDAALEGNRLLITTPVGVVSHALDWESQRSTVQSIDVTDSATPAGDHPALAGMIGIVGMPNGAAVAWNADAVFRQTVAADGKTNWLKDRAQGGLPVQRLQVLSEPAQDWVISTTATKPGEGAEVIRLVDGHEAGKLQLGPSSLLGDVSHPTSDHEWIYLPLASRGLLQVEKAKIR